MPPLLAAYALWAAWGLSWLAAASWAGRTLAKPAAWREWRYRIFTFFGFVGVLGYVIRLSSAPLPAPFLPLWQLPTAVQWVLVLCIAIGMGFCWWARIHLGRLWSASLTRKDGHIVIDSGPYAIVRHPIYTGLILAAIATVGIRATLLSMIGLILFCIGYTIKAREEERFLSAELGEQAYAAYRSRVPMLIPFGTI